jgi:hypothetical protein
MGLAPLPPPWRKGEIPTEAQRQMYRDYLVGNLSRSRPGRHAQRGTHDP